MGKAVVGSTSMDAKKVRSTTTMGKAVVGSTSVNAKKNDDSKKDSKKKDLLNNESVTPSSKKVKSSSGNRGRSGDGGDGLMRLISSVFIPGNNMGASFTLSVALALFSVAVLSQHTYVRDIPPRIAAATVAFSPLLLGALLTMLSRDVRAALWPFHRDPFGKSCMHLGVGFAIGVLPVYHLLLSALSAPATITRQ